MKQQKRRNGTGKSKKRILLITLSVIIVISLLLVFQLQTSNQQKKPSLLNDLSSVTEAQDLYYPHLVSNANVTVFLKEDTSFTYWGVDAGSYWIDSPNSNYNLSKPDVIAPNGGGQFTIDAGKYSGEYTIHVSGSMRILLSDRAISDPIWQNRSWKGSISENITAFDIENIGAMGLTITTNCNSSIYIFDDTLKAVDTEYVNQTTNTIDIKSSYSMLYNVVIVTNSSGIGTSLVVSYDVQSSQGDFNLWLIIIAGIVLIVAFIYLRFYWEREI